MNKTDLTDLLSHRAGLTRADAHRCVGALFDVPDGIIARALRRNEKVQITGFGTFETRRRQARSGRNPRTGEPIRIPSGTAAVFRPGKGLKDSL